jgi:fumarate hydratase, class II
MVKFRIESDSMGKIKVPSHALWGAQTQRALEHFSIGSDKMPDEMIEAYAILKKACAIINYENDLISKEKKDLIVKIADEIIDGKHSQEFPLSVWISGSGTQFNMNVNEVISNRASELLKKPLGSKKPLHPNDDVNKSQSTNDSFPSSMNIACALSIHRGLIPSLKALIKSFEKKSHDWKSIIKLGRTHMQDATPMTLGQEFSGYTTLLEENLRHIEESLKGVYELALGGTAVGTGINTKKGFDKLAAKKIASLTKLPFETAKNKFAVQGSHNALLHISGALKSLASTLFKVANDIRLLSCGPRAGFFELLIPQNEPGSSIMPGKVNPTQCEAMTMVSIQVMANDIAVTNGDSGGFLEMNCFKPLIIHNILHSIRILKDAMNSFDKYLVKGMKPNLKKIKEDLDNSLMLVTALTPAIGYDKASQIAHYAYKHNLSLKSAALKLGYISEEEFDKIVDPKKMINPS